MAPACNIPQLDEATFEDAILASPFPVFVHFAGRDCEGCELAMPCLAEVMGQVRGPVKCFCIDGTKHPVVAARYRVAQYPTILVFREGRVTRRLVGYPLPGELEVILRTAVA
ncbi:MAG: thioredoxin family protein [candidate division NC10 bacterium]|nr:thioredoxin family protein [candidate division NC10 bacterium]